MEKLQEDNVSSAHGWCSNTCLSVPLLPALGIVSATTSYKHNNLSTHLQDLNDISLLQAYKVTLFFLGFCCSKGGGFPKILCWKALIIKENQTLLDFFSHNLWLWVLEITLKMYIWSFYLDSVSGKYICIFGVILAHLVRGFFAR